MEDHLYPNDPDNTNQFAKGDTLVMGEDFILVGDPHDDGFKGSVTVYKKGPQDRWLKDVVLQDPNGMPGDQFGFSVARDGQYVIVGAPFGDDLVGGVNDTGAVLIYDITAPGNPPARLAIQPNILPNDEFGHSVEILSESSPPIAIVGAPFNDATSLDAGTIATYKFNGTSWVWFNTIDCQNVGTESRFGTDVAITSNVNVIGEVEILVGAPNDTVTGGEAFLFRLIPTVGWIQTGHMTNPSGVVGNRYGVSVAIDEDFAFISAPDTSAGGMNSNGAAYVYLRDLVSGWPAGNGYEERILGPTNGDHLGNDLALVRLNQDEVRAVVGVHADYSQGTNSGSVRFMDRSATGVWSDYPIYPVYGTDHLQFGAGVAMHVGSGPGSTTRIVVGAFQGDYAQVFDIDRPVADFTGPVTVEPRIMPGNNTFKTYGVEQSSTVHFLYGLRPGNAPYLGITTAFLNPMFIASATPNLYGEASINVFLPTVSIPVGLQAAEVSNTTGLCVSISVPVLL